MDTANEASVLCRLCANHDDQMMPIFNGDGLEHNIATKMECYLPITLLENDKLPMFVCYQCASTVISWHNLYEGFLLADTKLKELINDDKDMNTPKSENHNKRRISDEICIVTYESEPEDDNTEIIEVNESGLLSESEDSKEVSDPLLNERFPSREKSVISTTGNPSSTPIKIKKRWIEENNKQEEECNNNFLNPIYFLKAPLTGQVTSGSVIAKLDYGKLLEMAGKRRKMVDGKIIGGCDAKYSPNIVKNRNRMESELFNVEMNRPSFPPKSVEMTEMESGKVLISKKDGIPLLPPKIDKMMWMENGMSHVEINKRDGVPLIGKGNRNCSFGLSQRSDNPGKTSEVKENGKLNVEMNRSDVAPMVPPKSVEMIPRENGKLSFEMITRDVALSLLSKPVEMMEKEIEPVPGKPVIMRGLGSRTVTLYGTEEDEPPHSSPGAVTKEFICDKCYKPFTRKSNLTKHKKIHDRPIPEKVCKYCNVNFQTAISLKTHMDSVHHEEIMNLENEETVCKICEKKYKSKSSLKVIGKRVMSVENFVIFVIFATRHI